MSTPDDIVELQLLADDVADARSQTEDLLRRVEKLSRRVEELNRGDPGAGRPTRMDGISRFSRISDLRNELIGVAETICLQLDMDTPTVAYEQSLFFHRLHDAGVPLDTLFDALDGLGRDSPG